MQNKLSVIMQSKKVQIYVYNTPKCVWWPGRRPTREACTLPPDLLTTMVDLLLRGRERRKDERGRKGRETRKGEREGKDDLHLKLF